MKTLIFLCLGAVTLLFAEASTDAYTLEKLMDKVRKNNQQIILSRYQEQISALEKDIAKGRFYGKLTFENSVYRTNHPGEVFGLKLGSREATFNDFGFDEFLDWMQGGQQGDVLEVIPKNLNEPGDRTNFETSVRYEIPLYTGEKLTSYLEISKKLHKLARNETQKSIDHILFESRKTFYDIALMDGFEAKLTTIQKTIKRLESTVQQMQAEGFAKQIDVLEVSARLADTDRLISQTRANRKLAYDFLSFLANAPIKKIDATFSRAEFAGKTTEEALRNNPDIKNARLTQSIAEQAVIVEKGNFLPEAGAFARTGWNDDRLDYGDKNYYSVGIGLSYDLYSGGIDSAKLQQARIRNLQAKEAEALKISHLSLELARIRTRIKSLDYDIASLQKEVELKQAIYDNYQARYKENLISINDVLIRQSEHLQSIIRLQEKENERNHKIFEFQRLAGMGEGQ